MKVPSSFFLIPCFMLTSAGLIAATVCTQTVARLWADVTADVPRYADILSTHGVTPKAPQLSYADLIGPTADRIGVSRALVKSIIKAESAFNPDAVSNKGALGYMQVMPATAQDMGLDASLPNENLEAGTRYLKWLLARYSKGKNSLQKAIAAYNAGPGAVDKYHGIPKYRETQTYVARVMKYYKEYSTPTD